MVRCAALRTMACCLIAASIASVAAHGASNQNAEDGLRFLTKTPGTDVSRLRVLAKALAIEQWPKTAHVRVAPSIDKSLLTRPELVTRESKSYDVVRFSQGSWGRCNWKADHLVETSRPLPTELPAARKAALLKRLPSDSRHDPAFVKKFLQEKLKMHRESLRYTLKGEITVEMCLAPNSQAAHEYLLTRMAENTMPTDLLVKIYSSAQKLPDLGTLSYVTKTGHVEFIRDSVVVIIRSSGVFADGAMSLARKLDRQITEQPPLTHRQLLSLRPAVALADIARRDKSRDRNTVSCKATAADGQEVVCIRASTRQGQYEDVRAGQIPLPNTGQRVRVTVMAVTDGLLARAVAHDVTLPDRNRCGMSMRHALRIGAVSAIGVLCPIAACMEQTEDNLAGEVAQVHEFHKWAGRTQIPNKIVVKAKIRSSKLQGLCQSLTVEPLAPPLASKEQLSISLVEKASGLAVVGSVRVWSTPLDAHRDLLRQISATTQEASAWKRVATTDPGDPLAKVGDVCFVPSRTRVPEGYGKPVLQSLHFCRNNVAVSLESALPDCAKRYPDLRIISSAIDEALKVTLVENAPGDKGPWKRHIRRVKDAYRFQDWAGKTKMLNKEIRELRISPDAFRAISSKTTVSPSGLTKARSVNLYVLDSSSQLNVRAYMGVFGTVAQAHESVISHFARCTAPMPVYRRVDPTDATDPLHEIGDICFVPSTPWVARNGKPVLRSLLFCRNNVSVILRPELPDDAGLYPDLGKLALLIDAELIDGLTDKSDRMLSPATQPDGVPLPTPTTIDGARIDIATRPAEPKHPTTMPAPAKRADGH